MSGGSSSASLGGLHVTDKDGQTWVAEDTYSDDNESHESFEKYPDEDEQNDSVSREPSAEEENLKTEQGEGMSDNQISASTMDRSIAGHDLENKEKQSSTVNINEDQYREYSKLMTDLMSTSLPNKPDVQPLKSLGHNSATLPGPFAVSLVDRNHDPALTIVYHCWICEAEFVDKLGIVRHLKEWHIDVPGIDGIEKKMRLPICMTCGLSGGCEHRSINEDAKEEENGEDADKDGQANGKFPCEECKLSFETISEQRDHFSKAHPNQRMYKCSYCPDSFFQHHKLVVHTRTHTGYKPYACGICGSKFPKNSDLNRHLRTHSTKGEKPYACAQCGQTFTQKCSLEKHARRHADRDGGFPCFHCGLTFAYETELDDHSKKEHGERTWKCVECGKLFQERRHLIVHAKTHQEGVKFQCQYCDRTFSKRHQLAKHEDRIHHRQDDLKCKVCNKEFRRRENLTRHMNIHLDKREFQCTQCGMAFTEKGSLKRHVLSRHEQHRPFKCRLCGKAFSRRFLLRKHHIRAHKSYPFEGEENPMPTRGFGAKSVNIDSYIRINQDSRPPVVASLLAAAASGAGKEVKGGGGVGDDLGPVDGGAENFEEGVGEEEEEGEHRMEADEDGEERFEEEESFEDQKQEESEFTRNLEGQEEEEEEEEEEVSGGMDSSGLGFDESAEREPRFEERRVQEDERTYEDSSGERGKGFDDVVDVNSRAFDGRAMVGEQQGYPESSSSSRERRYEMERSADVERGSIDGRAVGERGYEARAVGEIGYEGGGSDLDLGYKAVGIVERGYNERSESRESGYVERRSERERGFDGRIESQHGYDERVDIGRGYEGRTVGERGYEGRALGERGYEGIPVGERGYEGRPVGERGYEGRPVGERGYEEKALAEHGFDGRAVVESSFERRAAGERGYEDRTGVDRAYDARALLERGYSDGRTIGERGYEDRAAANIGHVYDGRALLERGYDARFDRGLQLQEPAQSALRYDGRSEESRRGYDVVGGETGFVYDGRADSRFRYSEARDESLYRYGGSSGREQQRYEDRLASSGYSGYLQTTRASSTSIGYGYHLDSSNAGGLSDIAARYDPPRDTSSSATSGSITSSARSYLESQRMPGLYRYDGTEALGFVYDGRAASNLSNSGRYMLGGMGGRGFENPDDKAS